MELLYKPDFEEAKTAWDHYWAKEAWRRPLVVCNVPKPGAEERNIWKESYWKACHRELEERARELDAWFAGVDFLAESIPFAGCDFGPDQFAAFLSGTELKFAECSRDTNWHEPVVTDWDSFEFKIREEGPVWRGVLEYADFLKKAGRGKYLVGVCDLHSNMDALSALRGTQDLCLDIPDCPEKIDRAMAEVRKLYPRIYELLREAAGSNTETGSIGWIPFWCRERFATIQCDFECMIGPDAFNRFVRPALEEEAAFHDHCIIHVDGPGALKHLDGILSIETIDAVQWVPGDGQRPMHEWTDVLKRIQKAGKGLQIYGVTPAQVKMLSRELSPAGVVYCVGANDRKEVEELLKWLEANQ